MTEYVSLVDYVILAGEILELDPLAVAKSASLGLADSALHAPMAEFGGQEMYPVFHDKAAVLLVHLTKNHPLPDGNKRAGWASLRLFLLRNGWVWHTFPPAEEAEAIVVSVAAGEIGVDEVADWLDGHIGRA